MIWVLWIYLLFASNICYGEDPKFNCPTNKPYKSKDSLCTDFVDVCVKKDDADCKNFQSACEQCPPSNYSIIMFIDIIKVKDELTKAKQQLKNLTAKIEKQDAKTTDIYSKQNRFEEKIFALLVTSLIIIILSIIIIILEVRFKIVTKLVNLKGNNYKLLRSRYRNQSKDQNMDSKIDTILKKIDDINMKKIDFQLITILEKIDNLANPKATKTKFKIEGHEELLCLNIAEDDTIVKIKKDLCEKLKKDFKMMKMNLNGKILDDNNLLLSEIGTLNYSIVINCYFDNKLNTNEIIAVNVGCKSMSPKLIQIRKKQTIEDLKTILSRFHKTKDFIILKESTKLDEKKSINDLHLIDNDLLTVIEIETKKLKVSSIFDNETTVKIEYSTINKVDTLKNSIAYKNGSDSSLYILFNRNKCLNEDKYLYEYDIENELSIQYCYMNKLDGITIGQKLHKGKIAELFSATVKHSNKEILLLKYNVLSELNMKENKHIIKELEVFQIAKLHERFVKLLDIYHKENAIYVSMENMSKGTVNMYMADVSPLNLILIQRWSIQILDGLEYLHDYELILRDLNPNHILVDKDDNVKLYSFNVSKYKEFHSPSSLQIDEKSPGFHQRYFAPEIFLQESCGTGTDIWSFGAVLIKLSTGKSPFEKLTKENMIIKIRESKYIEYELPTSNNDPLFKDFIDLCLKPLEDRATVAQLKNHGFIKNI